MATFIFCPCTDIRATHALEISQVLKVEKRLVLVVITMAWYHIKKMNTQQISELYVKHVIWER